jgi:hypothetical protein
MVMEHTRRKTASGGVKLLESESSGRGSINKNALHLLCTARFLDVKPTVDVHVRRMQVHYAFVHFSN